MTASRRTTGERHTTSVWVSLSGLTILACAVSLLVGHQHAANGVETVAVLVIAGVKGRLIMREYMEVRGAPRAVRYLSDAWLGGLLAILLGIYFLA
jgi:hypothetical protein